MSFSGSVSRESHEGGLLVAFEGRAPGLYTGIRIVGGKFLGRVDSVIGPVNNAYIHIKPLADDLVIENTIGSPVEIAPRDRRPRNDRGRKKSDSNPNLKPGDWVCPKCKNHNYANKQFCNRSNCNEKKPGNNQRRNQRSNETNMKPGDWICPKCKNHNYASKNFCNRSNCDVRKPGSSGENKGRRNTPARTRRPDRRGDGGSGGRNSARRQTNRQSKSRGGNTRQGNNSRNGRKFNSRR